MPDVEERRYSVTLAAFREQLDYLRDAGYVVVSVHEALAFADRGEEERIVVPTFDDGNRSDVEHALPELSARGFRGTFFVSGNRIAEAGGLEGPMIKDLADAGMEVGSHGMTHRFLSMLSVDDQKRECGESKEKLEQLIGREVTSFAPPGGRHSRTTIEILKGLSYGAVCTSKFGYNSDSTNPYQLRRIPIVDNTGSKAFGDIIERSPGYVLPAYLRWRSLELVRKLAGEGSYGRIRSLLVRE